MCGLQQHVQKRFEESGPNRHHLIGRLVRVQVLRGGEMIDTLAAKHIAKDSTSAPVTTIGAPPPPVPSRNLGNGNTNVTVTGGDGGNGGTIITAPTTLAPPPPPKVKRPMSSRTMTPVVTPHQSPVVTPSVVSDEFASAPSQNRTNSTVSSGDGNVPYTPGPTENVTVSSMACLMCCIVMILSDCLVVWLLSGCGCTVQQEEWLCDVGETT